MKAYDLKRRAIWEMMHRAKNPDSIQNYKLASDIAQEQLIFEKRIEEYRESGRRLNKKMRNYLRIDNE